MSLPPDPHDDDLTDPVAPTPAPRRRPRRLRPLRRPRAATGRDRLRGRRARRRRRATAPPLRSPATAPCPRRATAPALGRLARPPPRRSGAVRRQEPGPARGRRGRRRDRGRRRCPRRGGRRRQRRRRARSPRPTTLADGRRARRRRAGRIRRGPTARTADTAGHARGRGRGLLRCGRGRRLRGIVEVMIARDLQRPGRLARAGDRRLRGRHRRPGASWPGSTSVDISLVSESGDEAVVSVTAVVDGETSSTGAGAAAGRRVLADLVARLRHRRAGRRPGTGAGCRPPGVGP